MNLSLTAQLAATGLLAALLPLSVVLGATDARRYGKLVAVTLFLTFDLIVFGGFTRLTDSGLGCPDWPGCYGQANPLQAHADISAAQAAMPSGPVTVVKAWIEMIHRYLAMAVGVLIVALMISAWWHWRRARVVKRNLRAAIDQPAPASSAPASASSDSIFSASPLPASTSPAAQSPWLPTFLFGFVCLQGAFGAWTVTLKLQPVIVTIHLLLGLSLLGFLTWLQARQHPLALPAPSADQADTSMADSLAKMAALRWPAALALVLLAIQMALGGWVSTNYATLACTDFPLCHGQVIPEMDYTHGFTLWRQLGMTASGDYLPFPALTAIHWTHRNFAFVVIAVVGWVAWRARAMPAMRRNGNALLGAIGLQFATGVATVYLQWPLALAVAHNAGAALLVLLLVMLNYKTVATARATRTAPAFPATASRPMPQAGKAFSTPAKQ